jgi:hypothetical protein
VVAAILLARVRLVAAVALPAVAVDGDRITAVGEVECVYR